MPQRPKKVIRLLIVAGLASSVTVSTRSFTLALDRAASDAKARRSLSSSLNTQTASSKNAQGDITALTPGETIEREMTTGESHTFKLALKTGQYLRVVIEQMGINLIITLSAPDGEKVVEVDSPSGAYGPEYVSFVAEKQGDYLLKLQTITGRVNTGRYIARIEELREASSSDRERAAVEKTFADGSQLLEQSLNSKETAPNKRREEALEKFETARSYWESHKVLRWEALALYSLGRTHRRMAHLKEASEYFRKALELAPQLESRDWRLTASVLNDSGLNYSDLGENELSIESLTRALKLFQEKHDRRGEGSALNNIGLSLYRANRTREVLPYLERALQLRVEEKDRAGEANISNTLGDLYNNLGEPYRALEYFGKSLNIYESMDENERSRNLVALAAVLNNRALIYHTFGDWQLAIDDYEQALTAFRKANDVKSEAKTQNNLGKLYYDLGDLAGALKTLNEALKSAEAIGDPTIKAEILIKIGIISASRGETGEALSYFTKARDLEANDRARAAALTYIGSIKLIQGDSRAALDYLEQALTLERKIENREGIAAALQQRGEAYFMLGDWERALEDFKQALADSKTIASVQGKMDALYGIARVERERKNLSEAIASSEKALELIEAQRTKVFSEELRLSYFSTKQNQYELYIDLRMRQYQIDRSPEDLAAALRASEQSRGRTLIDLLSEAKVDLTKGIDPFLLRQKDEVGRKLNAKEQAQRRLLSVKHTGEQVAAIEKEIDDLLAEYNNLKAKLKMSNPKYAQLAQPQPLSLSQIQQLLDDDTLLLEYAIGNEKSYVWLVSKTSIFGAALPKRQEIEDAIQRAYTLLTAPQSLRGATPEERQKRIAAAAEQYDLQVASLSRMLLASVVDRLGNKRLLIVGDGPLYYLPFNVLRVPVPASGSEVKARRVATTPSDAPYLIEEHEIVNLPSASVLAMLQDGTSNHGLAPTAVAVIADPVFDKLDSRLKRDKENWAKSAERARPSLSDNSTPPPPANAILRDGFENLPPLPSTRKEAQAIQKSVPQQQALIALDFEASRATVMKLQEGRYRIIHIATHGLFNTRHPDLSAIVLSLLDADGNPQDGFLWLHDIYNLKLQCEMVVLSACSTGSGNVVKGEGVVGLTRGFMYAGAPRVLASLWRVDDLATSVLMEKLYQHMYKDRMAPAAALRKSQVEMLKGRRWRSPFYWGGFILQGDWRGIH